MAIEVLIRRRFVKEKELALAPLVVRLRSLALAQRGYISGETLKCIDPAGEDEYLVRSTWRSVKDWKTWLHSDTRTAIQREIDTITGEATEYRIYEPLVSGIFPEYTGSGNVPSQNVPL
ncbi:MAG: antibiotic biosynthesis monooxygenase [Desulfosarcina sp.]|jgi:heme-degrading monooxygenase HmoA